MVPQRVECWQLTANMKAFGLYISRKALCGVREDFEDSGVLA